MKTKSNIVHIVNPFLVHTASWIYVQIIGLKNYNCYVFTHRKNNLDQFPFNNVISPRDFGFIKFVTNKIVGRIRNSYGLFYEKELEKIEPKLFHAHFGYEAVGWLNFVKKTNLPLITTFYGIDASKLGESPFWRKKYLKLFNYGTLFLAEGNNLKRQLMRIGCPEEKIKVQHLGVAVHEYPQKKYLDKINDEKTIILQIASFREKKGIEYSLEAIAKVKNICPNIEFRIIGSGDSEAMRRITNIVSKLNIENFVKLLGIKSHKNSINELSQADIFLHPSVTAHDGDNEGGSPVCITEASAVGLPILSTFHADIPEVVINGETGFLVEERNVESLVEKLVELIKDPYLRKSLGLAGREHILKEYNLLIQLNKLEIIYSSLIKDR